MRITHFLIFGLVCLCYQSYSQTTKVSVDLQIIDKDYIQVSVQPPTTDKDQWTFVIPEIIPGTYMKINHERYYKKFEAFDESGNSLKIKQKDNFIHIDGRGRSLAKITYKVRQSLGKGPVWDAMIACGGSIFTEDGYLMNAQMISGYFEGYEKSPFEVTFLKTKPMFGATSMKNLSRSEAKDQFYAPDYYAWIDQPIMYSAQFDTTQFTVSGQRFIVATHAELEKSKSRYMAYAAEKTMQAIDSFSGFHHEGDYYFLFYHVDYNRLKGLFKGLGIGAALEHKNSSVYSFSDYVYDTTYSSQSHIIAHEYFHTIAPLNFHSDEIRNFSFAEPVLSRHLWLYEGSTDYLATLSNNIHGLNFRSFQEDMSSAINGAENRKERSLTESSHHITKSSMFNWLPKMLQLINFYDQGKFIAFAIDVELAERTNGEKRWIDALESMKKEYTDEPFDDMKLREVVMKHTYPEFGQFYDTYIKEGKKPEYDRYLNKFGWQYLAKKSKIPAYSKKWIVPYYYDSDSYYVRKIGKNTLGLQEGDTLVSINGIPTTLENRTKYENLFPDLFYPREQGESINVVVKREGKEIELSGSATLTRKSPVSKIIPMDNVTDEQLAFREMFFSKKN